MGQDAILAILLQNQDKYVSGEGISTSLSVSRSAIWKSISSLRQQGYEIDSAPNKGYCLRGIPNKLDKTTISLSLGDSIIGHQLICLDSIDSTNTEVKRRANEGAPHGLVVTAEEQTAGKGRRGRSFHSPHHQGLYLSILLRPRCSIEEVTQLTPWIAVAVAQAIEECCGTSPSIKWTNDLLLQEKKISGILTELNLEADTNFVDYVVVGIGVNVSQTSTDFPEEIRSVASSILAETAVSVPRNTLCAKIILSINQMFSQFPTEKPTYLEKYRKLCLTTGRDVEVIFGTEHRRAKALSIDENFCLEVEYPQGQRELLSSGEVSVRGVCGYL